MKTEMVNKHEIKIGDTVVHNGELRTVCKRTFSNDDFMGLLLWGDSYHLGYKPVERVTEL